MKREGWLLFATLWLVLMTGWSLLTSRPCLGNNCLTLATGFCSVLFQGNPFYESCMPGTDEHGNQDECVHPAVLPFLCSLKNRTYDVWLFQCYPPPPPNAAGLHVQWMEEREYRCGTKCRSEFVTKKPTKQPITPITPEPN